MSVTVTRPLQIHEMDLFLSRAPKDLESLTPLQKDLLMQHGKILL